MSTGSADLAAEIRAGRRHGLEAADLRGADLRRVMLSCVSLHHAKLDGADLEECVLECVDLNGASLRGARLHRAQLDHVKATRADLGGATFDRAMIGGTELAHADLSGAQLQHSFFRNCNLERANLDDADLTDGKLAHTACTDATFRRTRLERVLTVGSTFLRADLATARRLFLSRDIVAESLSREVADDFERSKLVGVVAINPNVCFREWKAWLDFHPQLRDDALAIFAKYPDSGLREALLEGYAGPPGFGLAI